MVGFTREGTSFPTASRRVAQFLRSQIGQRFRSSEASDLDCKLDSQVRQSDVFSPRAFSSSTQTEQGVASSVSHQRKL